MLQESIASAKLLAGFAIHVRLLASACQRETDSRHALGKENAQNSQWQGETTDKVMARLSAVPLCAALLRG
jgi:hypothetical protein